MTMLETPVELFQNEREFEELLDLYRERAPKRVLEIGTFAGGTLYHWLQNATPGAVVVAIDFVHPNADRYPVWAGEGVEVVTISGDSNDPRTQTLAAEYGSYDWIFIDADHHDANVRTDWRLYRELTAPGAVVAFHDITPTFDPSVEVDGLWAELADAFDTQEFVYEPGRWGIGVVFLPGAA